jgi:uncharacterized protein (TIGR02246 family)
MMKKIFAVVLTLSFASMAFAQTDSSAPGVAAAPAPVVSVPMKKKKMTSAGDEQGIKKAFTGFANAWNAGDVNTAASYFTSDSSLINPMGQQAEGLDQVTQLLTSDLSGPMKGSQQSFDSFSFTFVMPNLALVDCTATVTGVTNPDGSAAQPMTVHVYSVEVNRGKGWKARALRAFTFLQPPSVETSATPVGTPSGKSNPTGASAPTPSSSSNGGSAPSGQ